MDDRQQEIYDYLERLFRGFEKGLDESRRVELDGLLDIASRNIAKQESLAKEAA